MFHIKSIISKRIKSLKKRKEIDENIVYQEAERIIKKTPPISRCFFTKIKIFILSVLIPLRPTNCF